MNEIRKPFSKILTGCCSEVLETLADNSVDAIVTDPPYGLSFMGKKWDYDVPSVEIWRECLRVLKHGGYLLSFAGTRTQHRMACNIEDAGFEIRDMIAWVYGSGFPKSLNIGKAVDKLQGNERATVREYETHDIRNAGLMDRKPSLTVVETKGTSEFEGFGTALKPALEPITLARKPIEKGLTVAENCLKWGTGGINIDGCRIGTHEYSQDEWSKKGLARVTGNTYGKHKQSDSVLPQGRFPANLIHDGSQEVLELFPMTKPHGKPSLNSSMGGVFGNGNTALSLNQFNDSGSAARFFYCAKASKSERNRGCEGLEEKLCGMMEDDNYPILTGSGNLRETKRSNYHPTVKPIALMEYLVKLVSREGQTVLDPFAGSGTTGIACKNLNRNAILIEREAEYVEIAKCRIAV